MLIRRPHVAGSFYPAEQKQLRQFCESRLSSTEPPLSVRAVILPHAGYVYSGETACRVLARVRVPEKNFLIGPNHRLYGSEPFAIFPEGKWETPLGKIEVDPELSAALLEASHDLKPDPEAHLSEHSLEVEVPFLQTKNPAAKIAPLVVGTLDLDQARSVALACGEVLASRREEALVVISTDMSHYESDEATRKKDRYALEAIENLDEEALVRVVRQHQITMCGFVPVYMLLVMKKLLGIRNATLVDYRTSADATGDRDRVVGYAGFIFE